MMTKRTGKDVRVIGVISDTHGLLRPEAVDALNGVELILHAGDIGGEHIINKLKTIAPVIAVRGNNDRDDWAKDLPETTIVAAGSIRIYMLHDKKQLDIDPADAGFKVVISGHSHKPSIEHKSGVLYLNPGSAGRRRFKLPITLAILEIEGENVSAKLVHLPL
jgi:uncharacterized protein